jgi:hypothetical protein
MQRPFTARLSNLNAKRINRRNPSKEKFIGSEASFTVFSNNPDLLIIEPKKIIR